MTPPTPARSSLIGQIRSFDYVFWICIFMELMERMAYYGVRLVAPVFMVLAVSEGGAGLTHSQKGLIYGAWAAMQSWLPTFAGGFADRYGYKRTIAVSVFLKAAGYAMMSQAGGADDPFLVMLGGTQLLAAGTGLFKPGIQGTMAHSIAKSAGSESMGWGLFYQSVNIGAAVAAFVPAFARDTMGWGWSGVFATCSVLVFSNLIPLFFYKDPVDERQTKKATGSPLALVQDSMRELFSSPSLLAFILISSGFWFAFHQLFDLLPNFVDDWTDSSGLLARLGHLFGNEGWVAEGASGVNIPQEKLLNINAILIMFTMFVFAWLSSKVSTLASTIMGMAIASLALISFVYTANVYFILGGVVAFTVGEMLASPKRQEYMASLAPPGKRALYLGYANMPDGVGWVLGSLIAGAAYEESGDKVNLTRELVAEHGDPAAVSAWLDEARAGHVEAKLLDELAKNAEVKTSALAIASFDGVNGRELSTRFAKLMPRGAVMEFAAKAVPTLPDGEKTTPASIRTYLFAHKHPGAVWWPFVATGLGSALLMIGYDRWARKPANRDLRVNPVYAGSVFAAGVLSVIAYLILG